MTKLLNHALIGIPTWVNARQYNPGHSQLLRSLIRIRGYYRGVEFCKRRVESMEMLLRTNDGKSKGYELLSQMCIEAVGVEIWITPGLATNYFFFCYNNLLIIVSYYKHEFEKIVGVGTGQYWDSDSCIHAYQVVFLGATGILKLGEIRTRMNSLLFDVTVGILTKFVPYSSQEDPLLYVWELILRMVTMLKLDAVQVLRLTRVHGFTVYRLHSKRYIVLGWFWPELFIKLAAAPRFIIIHHPRTAGNNKECLILMGAFTISGSDIFKFIHDCGGTLANTGTTRYTSFSTYWAVTFEDIGFFNLEIISTNSSQKETNRYGLCVEIIKVTVLAVPLSVRKLQQQCLPLDELTYIFYNLGHFTFYILEDKDDLERSVFVMNLHAADHLGYGQDLSSYEPGAISSSSYC